MKIENDLADKIYELQKQYPQKRSALIPALHLVQGHFGYLPTDVQKQVAELFGIDPNEVNSIVTFYDMFYDKPTGKHLVHVCKNLSCMLRGSDPLIESICHKLKVNTGEVTADGEFTVIPSECLGACDRAPMMIIDDEVIGPVKIDDLDQIFEKAKLREGGHG